MANWAKKADKILKELKDPSTPCGGCGRKVKWVRINSMYLVCPHCWKKELKAGDLRPWGK